MSCFGDKRVLITDSIDQGCLDILTGAGFTVDYRPGLKNADIVASIEVKRAYY